MTRQRITDKMLVADLGELNRLTEPSGYVYQLQLGNSTHKINNTLTCRRLDGRGTPHNAWAFGRGGTSKRDAHDRLRVMIAALADMIDMREGNL